MWEAVQRLEACELQVIITTTVVNQRFSRMRGKNPTIPSPQMTGMYRTHLIYSKQQKRVSPTHLGMA